MKKQVSSIFFVALLLQGCVSQRSLVGNPLVIHQGMVPVFTKPELQLQYESGEHGTNCYEVDEVLPPKTIIDVLEACDHHLYKVSYKVSEKHHGSGYVHQHFLGTCCKKLTEAPSPLQPLSLAECRKVFERCLQEHTPYCFGANNFEPIFLPKDYQFSTFGEYIPGKPFELRGFDCSGLVSYISNGILPHCTRGLHECGEKIYTFHYQQDYSLEEKQNALNALQDTDYVVFVHNKKVAKTSGSGHVMVSYQGGFIEFRSKALGCFYTSKENAMKRLDEMLAASKKSCGDLFIIRWHPEIHTEPLSF